MLNVYKCKNCGRCWPIPENHIDNEQCTGMGILFMDECERCEDTPGNNF